MNKKVITRFAPSPTGFLHIGGARTALFNYLFAKHHNGKFLLRIEDTDRARSSDAAINAIIEGMKWLELKYDEEPIYQFSRSDIHAAKAKELVSSGKAYFCFMSQDEINSKREMAIQNKQSFILNSPWRDADPATYPKDIKPVIRLKAPREGHTIIKDLIQGDISVPNETLDDMILLRSNQTPTYMLAVVVDDYDMGITHIIRGDDHLTNAARQILLYKAFGWEVPEMAHIPLIHGPDGAKLSKRHGALGIEAYKDMGYLPDALCNYLLRLGWASGDKEIISREEAINLFSMQGIGKGPARIDFDKMKHVNSIYLRDMDNKILADKIFADLGEVSDQSQEAILKAIDLIKPRCALTKEMAELAKIFVIGKDITISKDALEVLKNSDNILIEEIIELIDQSGDLSTISDSIKEYANRKGLKLGEVMKPIRALITGLINSPSVFEIIKILGKEESLKRLKNQNVK